MQEVEIEELCELGGAGDRRRRLGQPRRAPAGAAPRSRRCGARWRPARRSCCFSGDKLLGGPQAGLLVGRADAIAAARAHPLARALRLDKLSLAALEATLRALPRPERARAEIPVLAMLTADEATLAERARRLAEGIGAGAEIVAASAKVGGGALPLLELPGPVVAVGGPPDDLAARLRAADPPVVGRIQDGRLLLDPRTLAEDEIDVVARPCAQRSTG